MRWYRSNIRDAMAKFKVGDRVERLGALVPPYMRTGTISRVIPHPELPEGLEEYEVQFASGAAIFYEMQLKLVPPVRPQVLQINGNGFWVS